MAPASLRKPVRCCRRPPRAKQTLSWRRDMIG